ncbi:MAG TPA: hypothetical protein VKL19_16830 [Thermoanaerobaculia bacterium]|nr:hypothetical protein [Thermoanaerobaculia bacterium]
MNSLALVGATVYRGHREDAFGKSAVTPCLNDAPSETRAINRLRAQFTPTPDGGTELLLTHRGVPKDLIPETEQTWREQY